MAALTPLLIEPSPICLSLRLSASDNLIPVNFILSQSQPINLAPVLLLGEVAWVPRLTPETGKS